MDEIFTKKIRAAAIAGWWTLLIAYCILLIQWFAYLLIIPRQPAYKLGVGMMLFIVIWLTLWARQLKKQN
jgi:hypothetical protein